MKTVDTDVLVLAAGASQRLQEVLQGRPKPLIDVAGEPVLRRNLRWLAQGGVRQCWINLHCGAAEIQSALRGGEDLGLRLNYSYERQLLGTAGAARALAGLWRESLLVVYGDSLLRFSLEGLISRAMVIRGAQIAVFDPGVHLHTGIAGGVLEVDSEKRVTALRETRSGTASAGNWVSAGVYLMPAAWVRELPERYPIDFAQHVFPSWLEQGRPLYAYPIDGYCLGMDTPETYRQALEIISTKGLLGS